MERTDVTRIEFNIECGDSLWGSTDPDAEGYDARASEMRYAEIVAATLQRDYPNATVRVNVVEIVNRGNNGIDIDTADGANGPLYESDDDYQMVRDDIDDAIMRVFQGDEGDWTVPAS